MHNQHVCHAQSSASNSNPHPTPAHTHTKLANANRCCISNVNFLCISCLPKILLRQKLTHPPRRFSQGTRNLRTNCPRLSTKMCTVAGWPCLTQSTARAPATANMDTTLPHVMPTGKKTDTSGLCLIILYLCICASTVQADLDFVYLLPPKIKLPSLPHYKHPLPHKATPIAFQPHIL